MGDSQGDPQGGRTLSNPLPLGAGGTCNLLLTKNKSTVTGCHSHDEILLCGKGDQMSSL